MVSFPPESPGDRSPSDNSPGDRSPEDRSLEARAPGRDHLAPVTNLSDVRRTGLSRGTARGGMQDHPSVRHFERPTADGRRSKGPSGDDPEESPQAEEKSGKRASNVSMHQLARRGMSRWELEQVLAKREIEPEIAAAELDRLESVGLLDDAALAVTLVYTQHTRKGLGRSAIQQELKRRHIDPIIIEDALEEIADDDELERATELAVKRIGQMSSYDDETVKRRLHGFLARKGYSSDVVRKAMDAAFGTRGKRGVRFQ
jgi:regulatory protein